ncbi:MAG: hypothetical protein Q8O68_01550 [Candidatus Daviesbacteria bacterium]|nr:hypothetical protein [Candidatus Daviesbacteria bacterium]
MFLTIFGFILLISPFILLNKFRDKKLGLAYILVFIICTQFIIAVFTQGLGIFTYSTILILNVIISVIIILTVFIKTDLNNLLTEFVQTLKKLDPMAVFVLIIAFVSLIFVHYNYSGKYTAINVLYQETESMRYTYPYYSDEWYAVAFIQQTIDSHTLPIINPLVPGNTHMINLELPFHSFMAEITLLLGLNPLTDYSLLAISVNTLIILLIYLFLIINKVNRLISGIISLSTLYITNGASLPGIWYLLPLNFGLIVLLLSFIFISTNNMRLAIFMALPTLIFYPPLFVFYTPALLIYLVTLKGLHFREKTLSLVFSAFFVAIAGIIVSLVYLLAKGELSNFYQYIFLSKIYYPSFTPGFISNNAIYDIVPTPILLLAIFGSILLFQKKLWLVGVLTIGSTYWIIYSSATFRFIIEYERAIFVTSILLIIVAGLGLNYLVEFLKTRALFRRNNLLIYAQMCALLLFVILIPSYTKRENWLKLTSYYYEGSKIFLPAAPVNQYLQQDDLKLFSNIKYTRFLSLPWKGTVIGVATDNYPLSTKPGTITINPTLPLEFISTDCDGKNKIARTHNISYVYLPKFDCPNFKYIDVSNEGLLLYKFSNIVNQAPPL